MNFKNYITLFLFQIALFAQSNFINNPSIYEFLDRQEIKGRINLNHHQKPYSRQDILNHLQHLTNKVLDLNQTELEELEYYLKEYSSLHPTASINELSLRGVYDEAIPNITPSHLPAAAIAQEGRASLRKKMSAANRDVSTYASFSESQIATNEPSSVIARSASDEAISNIPTPVRHNFSGSINELSLRGVYDQAISNIPTPVRRNFGGFQHSNFVTSSHRVSARLAETKSRQEAHRDASANLSDITLSDQHLNISTSKRLNVSTTFLSKNPAGSFRFFEYSDSLFYFNLYPDVGGSYSLRNENKSRLSYYNGFTAYGSVGNNFSFDITFNDYSIKTKGYNIGKTSRLFTNEQGFDYPLFRENTKTMNYDRTIAAITYNWDWGLVSLRKDYNYWGTGYNGNLILSDKAPSFPFIQLKLKPVDWLEFNYIHGDLMSFIYDSLTYRNSGGTRSHIQLVDKYFVAHVITADVFNNLKLSLGESLVYSDRFEPMYLIPFLFYRMADHYLSNSGDLNSGNAQIFASLSYRIPSISTRIDGSIFIDELSISNIFGKYPEAVAYSIGITNYDLLINNLGIQLEYTRINPFVYAHGDPAQTYANRGYQMGHWIGGNADQFFLKLLYKPIPLLRLHASFEYTRKGDFEDISQPRYQKTQTFLFGDKSYYSTFRIDAEYEFINNLFLIAEGVISNAWGKNNQIDPVDYKYTQFTLGFHYGFQ